MNIIEKEEFAVMKNEITHIKTDVTEIKETMSAGFSELKYIISKHNKECDTKYAGRWVEKVAIGLFISTIAALMTALITVL